MSQNIFISHSTSDDAIVNQIADALESHGYQTWVDHRAGIIPGDPSWDRAIRNAIDEADVGILVMSPRSLASDICASECLLVREIKKPLFILRIEGCNPLDIWLYIKMIQYANLVGRFEAGMNEFLRALAGDTHDSLPQPYMNVYIPPSSITDSLDDAITKVMDDEKPQRFFILGTPHIGKTALLDWLMTITKDEDLTCLRINGSEMPMGSAEEQNEWMIEQLWQGLLQYQQDDLIHLKSQQNTVALLPEKQLILRKALAKRTEIQPILLLIDDLPIGFEIGWRNFFEGRDIAYKPVMVVITQTRHEATFDKQEWGTWHIQTLLAPLARDIALQMGGIDFLPVAQQIYNWAGGIPIMLQNLITTLLREGVLTHEYDALILQKPLRLPRDWHERITVDIIHALGYMPDVMVEDYDDWQADTLEWLVAGAWLTDDQGTFALDQLQAVLKEDDIEPDIIQEFLESLTRADNPIIQRLDNDNLWRFSPAGMRDALRQHPDVTRVDSAYWGKIALNTLEKSLMPDVFAHADRLRTLAQAITDLYMSLFDQGQDFEEEIRRMLAKVQYYSPNQNRESRISMQQIRISQTDPHNHTMRWHLFETLAGYMRNYKPYTETAATYQQAIDEALLAQKNPQNSHLPPPKPHEIARLYGKQAIVLAPQDAETALKLIANGQKMLGDPVNRWDWLADDFFDRMLTRPLSEQMAVANLLSSIAYSHAYGGKSDLVTAYYKQALSLHQEVGNRSGVLYTLINLGTHIKDEQTQYYEKALVIARDLEDLNATAFILKQITNKMMKARAISNAKAVFKKISPLFEAPHPNNPESSQDSNWEAIEDFNVFDVDISDILELFEQTLSIFRKLGNKKEESNVLYSMGMAYQSIDDKEKSLECFQQALPLFQQMGNLIQEISVLKILSNLHHDAGDVHKACQYLQQASDRAPVGHLLIPEIQADLAKWGC